MCKTTILSAAALGALLATSVSARAGIAYTFTEIAVPRSLITSPSALNNIGQIVGTYIDDAGNGHGFLETGGRYVTVEVPGAVIALGGINDFGQIVGIDLDKAGNVEGFLDTHGKSTTLNT